MARAHAVPPDLFSVGIVPRADESLDLIVSGELDLLTGAALESALLGAIDPEGSQVTLDLADLTFIDSSGLLVLLSLEQHSEENGEWLRIRCGSSSVIRRVIKLCGAEGRLPLQP